MTRAPKLALAPVMKPNVAPPKVVFGLPGLGWLKRLKASPRSWKFTVSQMGKFLKSEKLVFAMPGALTAFRCRFPNVPAVGLAYAVGSIQLFLVDPPAPVTVARLQV